MKMDLSLLRRKFRGTMLGVLTGDCLGSPYENEAILTSGERLVLQKSLDKLEGPSFKAPVMQFSDDSAMTRSVAESLIEKGCLDLVDMARKFVKSYYQEPFRGYGAAVVTVFQKLRGNKFSDVLGPAKEQFHGQGSMGNGGAMRIAPIALLYHKEYNMLIEMTRRATEITHTHKMGVDGAILQAIAIQQCILLNPEAELNTIKFVEELIDKMNFIEVDDEGLGLVEAQPFKSQLLVVKKLLKDEGPHAANLVLELGNDVTAIQSVPTAIFCFLRAQKPIDGIQTHNPLRRAIQYAISLGGDTDTIAAMAGALAGAFYGETKINSTLLEHCEGYSEFRNLGDKLYEVFTNKEL